MFLTCRYYSRVLERNVEVNLVIPSPQSGEQILDHGKYDYEKGLPVVYLLHGMHGDGYSWMRFSSIERYLQDRNIVGVMAGVENSFYQDMAHGGKYYTFMTEELPAYVTRVFPVSKRREDTYVAGFSMGGYGAWFLALSRPDLFAKAASMSGALDIETLHDENKDSLPWDSIFKDAKHLGGSDYDLFALFEKNKRYTLPLFQSCGDKDFLFGMNQNVHRRMERLGASITYREVPGFGHTWDFWDKEIQEVLDWLMKE